VEPHAGRVARRSRRLSIALALAIDIALALAVGTALALGFGRARAEGPQRLGRGGHPLRGLARRPMTLPAGIAANLRISMWAEQTGETTKQGESTAATVSLIAQSRRHSRRNAQRANRFLGKRTGNMGETQTMLGSKKTASRSTRGRTWSDDGAPQGPARGAAVSALDEPTKAQIYRQARWGGSIEALARRFGLSRPRIEQVINEIRARRLLETKLQFMTDPSFDVPARVAEILGPSPGAAEVQGPRRSPALEALPPYLASLHDVPLLSREQERHLFLKMNYLKYRAHQLREGLVPSESSATQLDEIERLQEEALVVKNQITRANLRLVVSIARKYVGPRSSLFELISDGNIALIHAVEKFDASRGFKFSTYASWVIMRGFSRSITEKKHGRDRLVTGHEDLLEIIPDTRTDDFEQESDHRRARETVQGMLGQLNDRERHVLVSRFGIGGADVQTLEQIGRAMGISKERVRQIEASAQKKLHSLVLKERLDPAI
jgi:RNA polymerase primary sigma factor